MRHLALFIVLLAAVGCTVGTAAHRTVAYGYTVSVVEASPIGFEIDSIDFRSDLTRIYGKLIGTPHTSNRIDRLTLTAGASTPCTSTDIDGIDMKRWFQWEDSFRIPVEIDFPMLNPSVSDITIEADGPKGSSKWVVTLSGK